MSDTKVLEWELGWIYDYGPEFSGERYSAYVTVPELYDDSYPGGSGATLEEAKAKAIEHLRRLHESVASIVGRLPSG